MSFLLRIITIIGILLLILVVVFISLALVLGLAIGVGWFLILLSLPFTLFEASLLGIIASIVVGMFWFNFLQSIPQFGSQYDDAEFEYDDYEEIPATRFYKTETGKTWEAWLRYHLANSIYIEFQDSPQPVAPMGEKQLQELAIRLSDLSVSLLKGKSSRAKELKVTVSALKRQMNKMGQRPYDDDILSLATTAINEELGFHYEDIITVIRSKLWNKPCELFDWE